MATAARNTAPGQHFLAVSCARTAHRESTVEPSRSIRLNRSFGHGSLPKLAIKIQLNPKTRSPLQHSASKLGRQEMS